MNKTVGTESPIKRLSNADQRAAIERESCAVMVEDMSANGYSSKEIAQAIRLRGDTAAQQRLLLSMVPTHSEKGI